MIGKIMTGKSFRGCLQYCLHDKIANERINEVVMKDRSEVILYNQCFGNDKELVKQFNEVRQLNPNLSKPVLHVTLSLSQGESLPVHKLAEMAEDCASQLGFSNSQYVAILHKDTAHQHIHLVANRVGFDGKTVSDSNNFKKMAQLCRKLELKHDLKQVLSPKAFLPKELREIPRLDQRKEKLKVHIKTALAGSKTYEDFEQKMKALKYEVIRMRGIAFKDAQKVYTKGSEVGYSLGNIERILAQKQSLKPAQKTELTNTNKIGRQSRHELSKSNLPQHPQKPGQFFDELIEGLTLETNEEINPELTEEQIKRRRKQRHRH